MTVLVMKMVSCFYCICLSFCALFLGFSKVYNQIIGALWYIFLEDDDFAFKRCGG